MNKHAETLLELAFQNTAILTISPKHFQYGSRQGLISTGVQADNLLESSMLTSPLTHFSRKSEAFLYSENVTVLSNERPAPKQESMMNGNGIIDIIREQMFLVSLKACNNLFSLNKKQQHNTQNALNKTLMTTNCRKLTSNSSVGL